MAGLLVILLMVHVMDTDLIAVAIGMSRFIVFDNLFCDWPDL